MSQFDFIKTFVKQQQLIPGMFFETTLLGWVPYKKNSDGEFVGYIPEHLQTEANQHGFLIQSADYKRALYVIQFIKPV